MMLAATHLAAFLAGAGCMFWLIIKMDAIAECADKIRKAYFSDD